MIAIILTSLVSSKNILSGREGFVLYKKDLFCIRKISVDF